MIGKPPTDPVHLSFYFATSVQLKLFEDTIHCIVYSDENLHIIKWSIFYVPVWHGVVV